jgi:YYY domain-containing protein
MLGLRKRIKAQNVVNIVLAGTLLLAIGLRIYGIDWDKGYAYTPHPDERAILMNVSALEFPSIGDWRLLGSAENSPWNPRWFAYGSFPLYLLRFIQYVYDWLPWSDINDLRIVGRSISALADVAAVAVVYFLGRSAYGRREGLLAAAMASVAVIHIQLSHFYAVDTLLSLFTAVSLFFMYLIARDGKCKYSVLAGLFIGLGLATKISQAPILFAYAMAHILFLANAVGRDKAHTTALERARISLQGIGGGVAAMLVALLVVQPYMFLDWSNFYSDVVEQSEMVRRIRDYPYTRQYIDTPPYWYQIRQLATWGLGWPMGIVAWAGLVYAGLRSTPVRFGLAYLALGWAAPMLLLCFSTSILVVLASSLMAFMATVAMIPLKRRQARPDLLLLAWVLPYLLIIGALEVKFVRYLLPVTPILLIFGARLVIEVWERVSNNFPKTRPIAIALGILVLASTGLYAIAYVDIYGESHTAVRTSNWLKSNAPKGAVILKEHWEEAIPGIGEMQELPLYEDDTPFKFRRISEMLSEGDYIVLYSNRLYGTIPRLEERYPISREYYRALFGGQIGYELVNLETAYPTIAGVSIVHETFSRPGLSGPAKMSSFEPKTTRKINLGFADESFSVYDHPTAMVFMNVEKLDALAITNILDKMVGDNAVVAQQAGKQTQNLLLSPEDAEAQRKGGTWAEIVRTESWSNRHPALSWLIVLEGMAFIVWPLTFFLFQHLPDRGYLFAKLVGLLGVGLITWLLASLGWMAFSSRAVGLAVAVIAIPSFSIFLKRRAEIAAFLRAQWRVLVLGEAIFLTAFFALIAVRMVNPDLWHPYLGGEKPMDFAYLNAVLKSSYMPPYDPWFAGGYMNYYYFGQFLTAMLIHVTAIEPSISYNIAVPMFFALTVSAAFCLVYNLVETSRISVSPIAPVGREDRNNVNVERLPWPSIVAGLGGAIFVAVLGNLDGAIQVAQGVWGATINHLPAEPFDYWRSTRMMQPGNEITEFPFFTFLFADLHAHLMGLPFTLLAIGMALVIMLDGSGHRTAPLSRWRPATLCRLIFAGIVVGALRLINTWDYPTYILIVAASIFLSGYFSNGGWSLTVLIESCLKALLVFLVGYVAFLPYHLSYETFFSSIEATTNTTVLGQFLAITGVFVFIIGSFILREAEPWFLQVWQILKSRVSGIDVTRCVNSTGKHKALESSNLVRARLAVLMVVAFVVGTLIYFAVMPWTGSTIPFISIMSVFVIAVAIAAMRSHRADAPQVTIVLVMVGVSLSLAIGLDLYRIEGDIDRMNSVFKFYLQIWVILAVSASYLLWRMWDRKRTPIIRMSNWNKLWVVSLSGLIISASIYPVLGTQSRARTRFDPLPGTLNGTTYMKSAVYRDINGPINLSADYDGIRWLQFNVMGSPVILEGVTPQYRWGGRISVYTGLPTVVGWKWHQEQQRWGYRQSVRERHSDVDTIYSTSDSERALALLHGYGVEYIYVGQLERLYYPEKGLAKFDIALSDHLDPVFRSPEVTIYRLQARPDS